MFQIPVLKHNTIYNFNVNILKDIIIIIIIIIIQWSHVVARNSSKVLLNMARFIILETLRLESLASSSLKINYVGVDLI
jgi:hypothetical protein